MGGASAKAHDLLLLLSEGVVEARTLRCCWGWSILVWPHGPLQQAQYVSNSDQGREIVLFRGYRSLAKPRNDGL